MKSTEPTAPSAPGRVLLVLVPVLLALALPGLGAEGGLSGRLDVSQIYGGDSESDLHLSLTEYRSRMAARYRRFGLHLDGYYQQSWTSARGDRAFVDQLYLDTTVGERGLVGLGRQVVTCAGSARVDGLQLGWSFSPIFSPRFFAGLAPHPLTNAVDPDFLLTGVGVESRGERFQNQGGLAVQLFGQRVDRVWLSDSFFSTVGSSWSLFGSAVVDFLSPMGLVGDIGDIPAGEQQGLDRLDLTNAQLMARYRPGGFGDVSLSLGHQHTILPNLWYKEWIQRERERLGIAVDGEQPIGTRRSQAQLTLNANLARAVALYTVLRTDVRHADHQEGYEGRQGVKVRFHQTGFFDLSYAYRRYYVVDNQLVTGRFGLDPTDALGIDVGLVAMHSEPTRGPGGAWYYDGDVGLLVRLDPLAKALRGVGVLLQYQIFVEPSLVYHLGLLNVGYQLGH